MGLRIASGTKPSMLKAKVPNAEEQKEISTDMEEQSSRIPASSKSKWDEEFDAPADFAQPSPSPEPTAQPMEAQAVPSVEPQASPQPQAAPQPQDKWSEEYDLTPIKKTKFDEVKDGLDPFEGSFAGVKFKKDKMGQYFYYQKGGIPAGIYGLAKGGIMPEEKERRAAAGSGWVPVDQMPDSMKNYLNTASAAWLDMPEMVVSTAAGVGAGLATGGASLIPALLAEVSAGGLGGYLGGSLAKDRFDAMLNNTEDSKKIAFLQSVLPEGSVRPTSPGTAAVVGAAAGLIPGAIAGARTAYVETKERAKLILAKAKPLFTEYINEISDFAEKIGVNLDGYDIARQVDPQLDSKLQQIESGKFTALQQTKLINSRDAKMTGLLGAIQAMRDKYAPMADELMRGPFSVLGKRAPLAMDNPFSTKVLKGKPELNFFEAMQDAEKFALQQNSIEGKKLAGDYRFREDQIAQAVEEIFETAFPRFKELRAAGASDAAILNELKRTEPGEFNKLVKLYQKFKAYTSPRPMQGVMPGAGIRQPSDFRLIDTEFDAIPPERFQNKAIQEQLTTIRKPIEPQPIGGGPEYQAEGFQFVGPDGKVQSDNYVGFGRPPYTDPTTGKTLYGRGDLADRAYYVTGGPAGVPGAPMPQLGQLTESGSRLPGGVSASRVPVGDQIQESLFGSPVGSAAGPKGVETSAKRFMGPKAGGQPSRGLSFDEINELTNAAQQAADSLEKEGMSQFGGVAKRLASAFRNFEDDSLFKLGVVRGDEAFAAKVLADKSRFANNARTYELWSQMFDKNSSKWSGVILDMNPAEVKELFSLLNESQKEQIKGLMLDATFNENVYSILESGVGAKINPKGISKGILQSNESRENIKNIFGQNVLKELDNFVLLADFIQRSGINKGSERQLINAVSRLARSTNQGTRFADFLNGLLWGQPTAQKVLNTAISNYRQLIELPGKGVMGKIGKAAQRLEESTGAVGRVGISVGAKNLPTMKKAAVRKEKEEEPTLGELEQ
jgi:hypothetical protein